MTEYAKLTEQAAFEMVCAHLLIHQRHKRAMGPDARDGSQVCLYRTPTGLKCAIGALIPDELYRPEFEGCGVDQLHRSEPGVAAVLPDNRALLSDMQVIHDTTAPDQWARALLRVADEYGLLPPPYVVREAAYNEAEHE